MTPLVSELMSWVIAVPSGIALVTLALWEWRKPW